jgi:N-acyl-D-aspartate/D-glutamate deacylase
MRFIILLSTVLYVSCQQQYDIVIKGGTIIDGSGNIGMGTDIGIIGDRIIKVGAIDGKAKKIIDATGYVVSPGFIDVHSHASGGLTEADRSDAKSLLTQGLTTVFINPDGGGSIDLNKQDSALLHDGLGINVAQMVPHGSIRREVMGMDNRLATDEELEKMKAIVTREMNKGAFGLSSGPFYTPGSYSDTRELVEVTKVIAPFNGVYTSHIRDESNYTIGLEAAVDEVITVAREAEVTGIVTHIKALGPPVWGMSQKIIANIEKARAEGVNVYADQYPYNASATGLGAALLPRWSQAGGHEALLQRLNHPDTLSMITAEMEANLLRRGGPDRIQFRYFEPDPSVQGKTLEEVSSSWNLDPISAAIKMIRPGKGIGIVSFNMSDEDVHNFMQQTWTMTCSDGSYPRWGEGVPHPRSIGSFPRKIRKYVLEENVISLPHAIYSMTGLSAEVFGLKDRGIIREGAIADIVIFEREKMNDKATFTDPFQYSEGIIYSILNGEVAIDNEEFKDIRAGKIIKKNN